MNNDQSDGGPAFPCAESHTVAADVPWTCGMSKRELFAAILMHGEFAARDSDEIVDELAINAVLGADALLGALSEPRPTQCRELYTSEQEKLAAAERLANIVEALQKAPGWADLPEELRISARNVASDVLEPPLPF